MPQIPNDDTAGSGDDHDALISRLYDVALDPTRYEALLDQWESIMGPLRGVEADAHGIASQSAFFAEHFRRADAFLDNIGTDIDQNEALLGKFDKAAALLFGSGQKIIGVNAAAHAVFSVDKSKSVGDLPIEEEDALALAAEIARLLAAKSSPPPSVFRVRSKDLSQVIIFHMQQKIVDGQTPLVLAVSSQVGWPENFSALLIESFGYTSAEVDVVRQLIECASIKEIAVKRERSVDTVRVQIKSVLSKTEVNSQVELVRLVLSMMDIASFAVGKGMGLRLVSQGFEKLEPRPFITIFTDDGRRLDYLVLGDPKGTPVLFLPLNYGLIRWPASAEAQAAKMGIKVIVPVRAGFGNTDQVRDIKKYVETVCADTMVVLKAEGVGPCPVVSLSSDFMIATHLSHYYPGQVTAVLACGGMMPNSHPEMYERMDKWHRFILASARYTPKLLPFMVKSGLHLARRIGKRGFVHAVYGGSEADISTFEEPEVFEAMVTGSEVMFAENADSATSFSLQLIHQETNDWRDKVMKLKNQVPVHFICGLQSPEVHPDTLAFYQVEYPWVEYSVHKDAGELIFFRHWRTVLQILNKYLPK